MKITIEASDKDIASLKKTASKLVETVNRLFTGGQLMPFLEQLRTDLADSPLKPRRRPRPCKKGVS